MQQIYQKQIQLVEEKFAVPLGQQYTDGSD